MIPTNLHMTYSVLFIFLDKLKNLDYVSMLHRD